METSPISSNRLAPRVDPRSSISNPRANVHPLSSGGRDVSRSNDGSINCRFASPVRRSPFYRRPDETGCRTRSPMIVDETRGSTRASIVNWFPIEPPNDRRSNVNSLLSSCSSRQNHKFDRSFTPTVRHREYLDSL